MKRVATVIVTAAALLIVGGVLARPGPRWQGMGVAPLAPDQTHRSTVDDVDRAILAEQRHLAKRPDDWVAWAQLAMAHLQLARLTTDLSEYTRAERALRRSLEIKPAEANADALIGLGALAAGRHDFIGALALGQRAVAVNGYSAAARGVVVDALVELGRYDEADIAVQRMVDLRPDTGSYARASYLLELRGDIGRATDLMRLALDVAPTPADVGFTRYHLAELAFGAGDLRQAESHVVAGLVAAADYQPLRAMRARIVAARGNLTAAIEAMRTVTAAVPLPAYVTLLGEWLEASGDHAGAAERYALARAEVALQAAQGVNVDLDLVLFNADHGDPVRALADARAGYRHRPTIVAEDALAWALHANHRDHEAVRHARAALRLGTRDALMFYHLAMIEFALGESDLARRDVGAALRINPYFSVARAAAARGLLATWHGR